MIPFSRFFSGYLLLHRAACICKNFQLTFSNVALLWKVVSTSAESFFFFTIRPRKFFLCEHFFRYLKFNLIPFVNAFFVEKPIFSNILYLLELLTMTLYSKLDGKKMLKELQHLF